MAPRYYGTIDGIARFMMHRNLPEPPWTPNTVKLSSSKVALVTTAGFFVKGQAPFRDSSLKGDFDYRPLDRDLPVSRFTLARSIIDRRLVLLDPNILFPIDRLKELKAEGLVGEVAQYHYSFYSYSVNTPYLMSGSAPSCARRLRYEGVDKVVIIPASILSEEMAVLIQRTIEKAGISTVSLLYSRNAAARLKPPRACILESESSLHRLEEYLDPNRQKRTLRRLLEEFDIAEAAGQFSRIE